MIDTGGLSGAPETLDAAMAGQTLVAVEEADMVVFIVDGRSGLVPVDEDIASLLRRLARRVVLCVNKIDGIGEDKAQLEFHQLGFEPTLGIAASHNRGVHHLIDTVADVLGIPASEREEEGRNRKSRRQRREEAEALAAENARIAAEAEAGEEVPGATPLADSVEAARLASSDIRIAFVGRPNVGKSTLINRLVGEERVIAYDQPGTTRDTVCHSVHSR